jgi:hypothetical protein
MAKRSTKTGAATRDPKKTDKPTPAAGRAASATPHATLLDTLRARFVANMPRHPGVAWEKVAARLDAAKLRALQAMEESGGEPDVVTLAGEELWFVDCAAESPSGRRSLCYDGEAQRSRKEAPPQDNAAELAERMGIELLTEAQYRELQTKGQFDLKTSSWVRTPPRIRGLGGALFCDRRYDTVFVYHNGAQSYYAARGFRGALRV